MTHLLTFHDRSGTEARCCDDCLTHIGVGHHQTAGERFTAVPADADDGSGCDFCDATQSVLPACSCGAQDWQYYERATVYETFAVTLVIDAETGAYSLAAGRRIDGEEGVRVPRLECRNCWRRIASPIPTC